MITVSSFAIGDRYRYELNGLKTSVIANSPNVSLITATGYPLSNELTVVIRRGPLSEDRPPVAVEKLDVAVEPELVCNWNNIGLMKAYFIWYVFFAMDRYQLGDIQLWLDADARVRGDLSILPECLGDHDVGLVMHQGNHWLNGTIGLRNNPQTVHWIQQWWMKCAKFLRPHQPDWKRNDQNAMRNLIMEDPPLLIDLGERWASIPPPPRGSKDNPIRSKPTCADGLIWHWQASRGEIKGYNWPPPEEERPT